MEGLEVEEDWDEIGGAGEKVGVASFVLLGG